MTEMTKVRYTRLVTWKEIHYPTEAYRCDMGLQVSVRRRVGDTWIETVERRRYPKYKMSKEEKMQLYIELKKKCEKQCRRRLRKTLPIDERY